LVGLISPFNSPLVKGGEKQKKLAYIRMRGWWNGVGTPPLNEGDAEGRGIMNEVDIKRRGITVHGKKLRRPCKRTDIHIRKC